MSLVTKIEQDIKSAMIARDEVRLSVVRFLKSALKYAASEKKVEAVSDAEAQQVIQRQIKQRRESIDQFTKGGRADLADKESKEALILESYLPQQMADADLEALVQSEIKAQGATSKKEFGKVMKVLTEKLAGQADSRRISEFLGKYLQ